ncbi:prepronociceptin isoform X1 [Melanerpes formicivorus]|uniref:prepronociceptin isoform X1 n=1 Tax=Melanerpes formicivorus TaxID=211600 RepID=UPI00358EDB4D
MRAVLWDLLLLCLFARARGDCWGDCLHCDRHLYWDSFDVLICILECEGEAVPQATWEMCAAAAGRATPRPRNLQDAGDPWHEAVPVASSAPLNPLQRSGTAFQHLPPGTGKINPAPVHPSSLHPLSDGPQSASDSHAFRHHFALHSLKPDLNQDPKNFGRRREPDAAGMGRERTAGAAGGNQDKTRGKQTKKIFANKKEKEKKKLHF